MKLKYYEDNKWNPSFIRYAKETVLNIYNTNYAPTNNIESNIEVDDTGGENNKYLDHVFGKQQKVKKNEVELYLNCPHAIRNQDILLW